MNNPSRRRFLTQLGAAATALPVLQLLQACGGDSSSSATTGGTTAGDASDTTAGGVSPATSLGTATYQLSWLKDTQWVGEYQADTAGYWKALGLEVDMLAGGGEVDPTAVIVAGKALTGPPSAASIAGAITAGADLKIIATKYQKSPLAIVSLASKPITSVADLAGTTIGVSEFNTVTFETFLSLSGMTSGDLNVVPYNFDPTPLVNGEIDGLLGYINDEPTSLAAQGVETSSLLLADFGYDVISNAYVADGKTLADPTARAQLVALLAGIVQGWTDVIADPAALTPPLLEAYAAELDIDPAVGISIVTATNGLILGDGAVGDIFRLTQAKVDLTLSLLAKEQTAMDASAFDLTLMDDVYAIIG